MKALWPQWAGALLVLTGILFGGYSVYADDGVRTRDLTGSEEDRISVQDRAVYSRDRTLERREIVFHRHERACTFPGSDEASCDVRVVTDDAGKPLAASAPGSALGAMELRSAYGVSGIATAINPPVIAIVDAYDHQNIQKDLNTYSAAMRIPSLPACTSAVSNSATPCFKKVNQRGGTVPPSRNAGWALEIALDVEAAHAMCQNCSILLVEADSPTYTNLMAAVDRAVALGASVVSNSYGSSEFPGETSYDFHFNRPGIAFTFSSGDSGYGVEYPAASRYVTAVGGTSLFLNANGTYNSEVAWTGAGSGCSAYESKQPWQVDSGCSNRTVADVSAVADPNTGAAIYDSVSISGQRGWFQVGGTSLASPIIAALYALRGNISTNSAPASRAYSAPAGSLHDVLLGSTGSCGGLYLCTAGAGFDGPTGLGTPNGLAAF